MKRIITTLFVFSLAIGVFAPVTFSLTQNNAVSVQSTIVHAQATASEKSDAAAFGNIGECGVVFGSVGNCLAYIFYFIPFYVGGGVLNIAARFLDYTATLTLSSKMFSSAGFLNVGWTLMRDFANMFFIFILMYIALAIILGIRVGHSDPKHMIVSVILIAIVINFSMFITDVLIDTSNSLALVFYNQITVKPDASSGATVLPDDPVGTALQAGTPNATVKPKQIGLALASSFHPQIFTDPTFWTKLKDKTGSGAGEVPPSRMILLLLIMGTLYFVVAWSFFVAAFSFLGRMVELFVLIIFSPIAFVSYIVPGMRGMDRFGWSNWWSSLIKTCFAAPIYFLLILLITLILNGGLFAATTVTTSDPDAWIIILIGSILVPAIFLWIMLTEATKYAQKASGTVGEKLGGMANAAVKGVGVMAGGAVLGAATGGMAIVGRQTIGRGAEKIMSGKFGQTMLKASEGTGFKAWAARKGVEVSKGAQKASFDVRQTGAGQKFAAATGMKMDSLGTFSIASAKGGRESQKARQAAELERKRIIMQNKSESKPISKEIEDRKIATDKAKGELFGKEETYNKAKDKESEARDILSNAKKDLTESEKQAVAADLKEYSKAETNLNSVEKEKEAAEKLLESAKKLEAAARAEAEAAGKKGAEIDNDPKVKALAKNTNLQNTKFLDIANGQKMKDAKDTYTKARTKLESNSSIGTQQKAFNEARDATKKAKKDYEHKKHQVHEVEHGVADLSKRRKVGDDAKDADGNVLLDDSGKAIKVSKKEAMTDMGVHDLEGAVANAENSNFKQHLYNSMKKRYKDAKANTDNLGNITTVSTSGKISERTTGITGSASKQGFQAAVVRAVPTFIAATAVAGPLIGLGAAMAVAVHGYGSEVLRPGKDKDGKDTKSFDTQLDSMNTVNKNLKDNKETKKHDAEKDMELGTMLSKPIGATGEVINSAFSAAGMKTGGGGHGGGKKKESHDEGHGGGHDAGHGGGHGGGGHGGGGHGGH